MRTMAFLLGVEGFSFACLAAYFWWRSSQVSIDPNVGPTETRDSVLSNNSWVIALMKASIESARLNNVAAQLTALSAVLSTGASLAGLFL